MPKVLMLRVFFIATLSATILLGGCAHSIHQVHVSDFSKFTKLKNAKVIRATSEQFVILEFAFDTDYVEKAYEKLQNLCRRGRIVGISTQYSTSLGFFSWTNKVLMKGHCIRNA